VSLERTGVGEPARRRNPSGPTQAPPATPVAVAAYPIGGVPVSGSPART
jgi:hypothetical protein